MIRFFETLKHKGEHALRAALLTAAAAGLFVLALGFAAGALVTALATVLPLSGALLAGAGALAAAALVALAAGGARNASSPPAAPASAPAAAALLGIAAQSASLKDLILRLAEYEARTNPAAAAAIAAAAGLLLGALDAQHDDKAGP